jgi:hypothetical protein
LNRQLKQENDELLQVSYGLMFIVLTLLLFFSVILCFLSKCNAAAAWHVTNAFMQTVYSEQKSRYAAELQNSAVNQHARATVAILQGRLNSANHDRYPVLFHSFASLRCWI